MIERESFQFFHSSHWLRLPLCLSLRWCLHSPVCTGCSSVSPLSSLIRRLAVFASAIFSSPKPFLILKHSPNRLFSPSRLNIHLPMCRSNSPGNERESSITKLRFDATRRKLPPVDASSFIVPPSQDYRSHDPSAILVWSPELVQHMLSFRGGGGGVVVSQYIAVVCPPFPNPITMHPWKNFPVFQFRATSVLLQTLGNLLSYQSHCWGVVIWV